VSYSDLTVQQLRTKRVLANWIIHNLRTAWADDERAAQALARYRKERAEINAALREVQGIDPPDQRVGLKPLALSARRV
jgi:hypothetical protein